MEEHTVAVDSSATPASIAFAANFNTTVAFIDRHLSEGRADKAAVVTTGGETVTYGALAAAVNRAGNALSGLGIQPGDRVLMMVKDCPEFLYLFWGAIKAGIIPVPINTMLRAADYIFMIEDSGCAGCVYSPEFAAEVGPALEAADPGPAHHFPTEGDGQTLASLMAAAANRLDAAPASATDDCFWLYSSGTTGTPKGAVHSQRDMAVTCIHYSVPIIGVGEDDTCFSAAKLFFAYGLGNAMTFPLWVGATSVLYPGPPAPDSIFEAIERYRPTVFFGVPTLYAGLLRALESASPDLSSLRLCVSAGEALPADIWRRWKERVGVDILDGIGSTEALHIFISNSPDDIKPGASGRVVPGYEARIIDEQGNEAPAGQSGRLMIRGDSTAKHYWRNPEKTAATMIEGWLDTGDTYILDEAGYYLYCGRNDDMMKVGGIWCSPFEIEARLIEHGKVLEAAVVGRAGDDGLIKPEAFIVLNHADEETGHLAEELRDHCKQGLARYKYPRWFNFVDSLPKTATGKIQRYKLRQ